MFTTQFHYFSSVLWSTETLVMRDRDFYSVPQNVCKYFPWLVYAYRHGRKLIFKAKNSWYHKTKRHHSVKTERRHSVTFQSPFSRLNGRYISVTFQCHSVTIPSPFSNFRSSFIPYITDLICVNSSYILC